MADTFGPAFLQIAEEKWHVEGSIRKRTADADFELAIFIAMAPGQRDRVFAVDQTRDIGGILTAQETCLFISGHCPKVSPFAGNRSPAFRAGEREMVEAAGQ
ncbi:MAG TPA: hypothetical protein VM616_05000 [Gammaproteobacteria bacterium]|nr:hypothetical protein [Gammaproteobacteria bacterium]